MLFLVFVAPLFCFFAHGKGAALSGNFPVFTVLALLSRAAFAEQCGIKGAANIQSRIVNGVRASQCEWPWQASLQRRSYYGEFYHTCGGTLISAEWVLTAAHCVDGDYPSSFEVHLGEHDFSELEEAQVELSVDQIFVHPEYNKAAQTDYDFALVKLASPAPLDDCVRTACAPELGQDLPYGETCYVTGWGTTSEGGQGSDILRETSVTPLEDLDCKQRYGWQAITDVMFCAEGSRNGSPTDSCQGDSGGPLVCSGGDGDTYTLYGVVSWGRGCAQESYPGVYATVEKVLPWIREYVEDWSAAADSAPAPPPAPTLDLAPSPAATPGPAGSMWLLIDGPCSLDENFCITSPNYPENYPDNSECTIFIDSALTGPIHLEYFHTEYQYDFLFVNGEPYHGVVSPEGVIPEGFILWKADGNVARKGWKLCQSTPSFDTGVAWMLAGGNCEMAQHQCVKSPSFPQQYPHSSQEGFCNIIVNPVVAAPMHVEYFETEAGYDKLWVNADAYDGYSAPFDVVPSGTIAWSPDTSVSKRGWLICPQKPPPCVECFGEGSVWKLTGNCKVDGECVESSYYSWGNGYRNREKCFMELNPSYTEPLRVESFSTEADHDVLLVNNVPYSGLDGPSGVTPTSFIITWTSDRSHRSSSGWRLCAGRPTDTGDLNRHASAPGNQSTDTSVSTTTSIEAVDNVVNSTDSSTNWTTTAASDIAMSSAEKFAKATVSLFFALSVAQSHFV